MPLVPATEREEGDACVAPTQMPGDAKKQKQVWLIASVLLLAIIGGIVGINWWLDAINKPSERAAASSSGIEHSRGVSVEGPQPNWKSRGVRADDKGWMAWCGPTLLRVVGRDRSQRDYHFEFAWGGILDEAEEKIFLVRVAAEDPGTAAGLHLTAGQVAQLKQIPRADMKPTSAEKRNMIALFERYEEERSDRQKQAARSALLDTMRTAGQRTFASARRSYALNVAKVRAILTPEQIAQVAKLKWGRPLPSSAPSPTIDSMGEPAASEVPIEEAKP